MMTREELITRAISEAFDVSKRWRPRGSREKKAWLRSVRRYVLRLHDEGPLTVLFGVTTDTGSL